MPQNENVAYVLMSPEGRYFYQFGKKGQVLTAWSLAGATLFSNNPSDKLEAAEEKILSKGKNFKRVMIGRLLGAETRQVRRCPYSK